VNAFRVLAAEAFRDGLRRRLAFVVAITLLLGLAGAQSCTNLGGGLSFNGETLDPHVVGGFVAPLLFSMQALTVLSIAGLLAADLLARPLAEGSALLWLARPVSRGAWAGARLAGALGVTFAAGALLLGGTGAMLVLRQGVSIGPALAAAAATALGSVVVASLAMTASLALGRSAVTLLVVIALFFVVAANATGFAIALLGSDMQMGSILGPLDRYGPPLFRSILAAVVAWNPHVEAGDVYAASMLRLGMWAVASVALLVAVFRRREIES
jgi:ABC-type transport system involved in multi-copper enzyme maturation permease subunit